MKVWIEWEIKQNQDIAISLKAPKVFATKENLKQFWKEVRFPANTVDWVFELMERNGATQTNYDNYAIAEVELDEYFLTKERQEAEKEEKRVSKKGKT